MWHDLIDALVRRFMYVYREQKLTRIGTGLQFHAWDLSMGSLPCRWRDCPDAIQTISAQKLG
jgi:hypothetical protein